MKDMNFPIDIIWVNADYEIVHMVKNAQPDSYPEIFKPNKAAQYVLEVPAETISEKDIQLRTKMEILTHN